MKVLGMISGTSHDGIDVAVVDLAREGDVLAAGCSTPTARRTARAAGAPRADPAARAAAVRRGVRARHPDRAGVRRGRRRRHRGERARSTSSAPTARRCSTGSRARTRWARSSWASPPGSPSAPGVPVVSDVRTRDITVGGHGAPLVSLHGRAAARRALPGGPAALNLGGISNMTVLRGGPAGAPVAFDIGPANALIDAAVRR